MKITFKELREGDALTPGESLIIGLTDATYRQLLLASAARVPDAEIPGIMLSVAASLLLKLGSACMAHPALTAETCDWVKEFSEQLPLRMAQLATADEVKQ